MAPEPVRRDGRTVVGFARALTIALLAVVALGVGGGPGAHGAASDLPVRAVVPGLAADSVPAPVVYVAMGDSVAAGVGATEPATTGYVPLFAAFLGGNPDCSPACPRVELLNLGVSGATSAHVLVQQLPAAVAAIESGNVGAVTLDVGANDGADELLTCAESGELLGCLELARRIIELYEVNLDRILSGLRAAGGPELPVLVMTYYNPLGGCSAAEYAAIGDLLLEGGIGIGEGLNGVIRRQAEAHGALVAETYGKLSDADLVGGDDCYHPEDSGHAIIAEAFEDAWAER